MKIRWVRVVANALIAFSTSMLGLFTFDSLANTQIAAGQVFMVAGIISSFQALAAIGRELLREDEEVKKEVQRLGILGYLTIIGAGDLAWKIGLWKTLRDKKTSFKTKAFAILDNCAVV